jgi:hypothetical protein
VTNNDQKTRVQSAHKAFCTGWSQLTVFGSENLEDSDQTIFNRFFAATDEAKSDIGKVYSALVNTQNGEGQPIVSKVILDNNVFLKLCPESGGNDPDAGEEGAYWGVDSADNLEKFQLCDSAYEFSTLPADNQCKQLSDRPVMDYGRRATHHPVCA